MTVPTAIEAAIVQAVEEAQLPDGSWAIQDHGRPHRRPSKKPKHCAVVYIFAAPFEVLKVGMAWRHSEPRATYQHYSCNAAPSTLAKSIRKEMREGLWPFAPLPDHLIGGWIERNCQLVHLLLDADQIARPTVERIEKLLHSRLHPRFEGRRQ